MTRILLIGNYAPDRQHSMLRYAAWLAAQLRQEGLAVELLQPPVRWGRLAGKNQVARKWLGLIDKFIHFPFDLLRVARTYDVAHICDHSNAPYRHFLRKTTVSVTCHDMITVKILLGEFEGQRLDTTARILQDWILRSLKRIPHVICVSQTTLDDFIRIAGRPDGRLDLIPNPVFDYGIMPRSEANDVLHRAGIATGRPFFLHVGSNFRYKNRIGAMRLFGLIRQAPQFRDVMMVCVGPELPVDMVTTCKSLGFFEDMVVVNESSTDVLKALYNRAEALLFISLYEGFGWPVIEAQACGCPVVTSDREPMRTIAGDAGLLVDPDRLDLASAAVIANWSWLRGQRDSSIANAARYSEDRIAKHYVDFFQAVSLHGNSVS